MLEYISSFFYSNNEKLNIEEIDSNINEDIKKDNSTPIYKIDEKYDKLNCDYNIIPEFTFNQKYNDVEYEYKIPIIYKKDNENENNVQLENNIFIDTKRCNTISNLSIFKNVRTSFYIENMEEILGL